jgi:hypothetical protein
VTWASSSCWPARQASAQLTSVLPESADSLPGVVSVSAPYLLLKDAALARRVGRVTNPCSGVVSQPLGLDGDLADGAGHLFLVEARTSR